MRNATYRNHRGPLGGQLLGMIEDCPFYIDARTYQSWDTPQLVLDMAPGNPEGFSLGPGGGLHFVTRASACPLPGV